MAVLQYWALRISGGIGPTWHSGRRVGVSDNPEILGRHNLQHYREKLISKSECPDSVKAHPYRFS
jgi:hypothetical protein